MSSDQLIFLVFNTEGGNLSKSPRMVNTSVQSVCFFHQSLKILSKEKSLKVFFKMGCMRTSTLIAPLLGVGLQTHTQGNSGQVQEDTWIIGWLLCVGYRWAWAAPPEEDPQNELLHQILRLATSVNIWAIFQMSISWSQRKPWCSCYHKQLGWKRTQNTFFPNLWATQLALLHNLFMHAKGQCISQLQQ